MTKGSVLVQEWGLFSCAEDGGIWDNIGKLNISNLSEVLCDGGASVYL